MCRFALVLSEENIKPEVLLNSFADMAKDSLAPDGDSQQDGWGVAWFSKNAWQTHHSLLPIWEDREMFGAIPRSHAFAFHARSASFPRHKGDILFNQPYVNGEYAFVFNGLLKGVALPFSVTGKIGAEKIWNLLQIELKTNDPDTALQNVKELLVKHSNEIIALNIGLMTNDSVYSLNQFSGDKDYYTLHKYKENGLQVISSQPLSLFESLKKKYNESRVLGG
ncbi:MAG TPA: hypothetical protein VJC10_00865 [Patescibacteria group bacterium]|nr:hypothetical protein [Patescibacteria group bacterium]